MQANCLPARAASDRVVGARQGENLDELVRLHATTLLARARVLTRQPSDAWDLLQDTFERTLLRRPPLLSNDESRRWMLVIMTNLHVDRCRSAKRRRVVPLADEACAIATEEAREEPAWRSIELEQVRACLKHLDPRLREAYVLQTEAGLPATAIARRLGVPVATVATRLFRARRRLRELLRPSVAEG